ncbi:MAG: MoaD/ThiS family protein [Acidobacteria bacterium]|nr:MoaD/ThiS family protein [Acidobacteriota bacterium]
MEQTITVRFFGYLERLAGQRETCLSVQDSATVLDVLTLLSNQYGQKFESAIFRTPREVHTYFRVFINEREAAVDEPVVPTGEGTSRVALLVLPIFEGGTR